MSGSRKQRDADEWRELSKDDQIAHLKQRAHDLERDVFVHSTFADEADAAADAMQQAADDTADDDDRTRPQFVQAVTTYRDQALGYKASANEARNRLAVVRATLAAIEGTTADAG